MATIQVRLRRLIAPQDVRKFLGRLDLVDRDMAGAVGWTQIKNNIENFFLDKRSRLPSFLSENACSFDQAPYISVINVAAEMLRSGQFHMGRGVLSPDGLAIYSMVCRASERLVELNYYTVQKREALIKKIDDGLEWIG